MLVKDVMRGAKVIEKDLSLDKAADLLTKYNINSLIVISKNKIVGIITEEDLVEHFGERKKVSQIMSKRVPVIEPTDKISKARDIMKEEGVNILPVVDKKEGLVGVIGSKELLHKASDSGDFLIN